MKCHVRQASLVELLKAHRDYIAHARATGARILFFKTPCCDQAMESLVPKGKETWDSLTACPHCGSLFMKICTREKVAAVAGPSKQQVAS